MSIWAFQFLRFRPAPALARRGLPGLVLAAFAWHASVALAQPAAEGGGACGFTATQADRLQPEDFRKPSPRLRVVEDFHYGPNVEALVRPMAKGMSFGSDLDYTLWGYPNHHRALVTLMRLGQREKTDKPRGSQFTIDCYFQRALHFYPDDLVARMLYASYLGTIGRRDVAEKQLDYVVRTAEENAITQYNAGLVYLELGLFDKAVGQAQRAQAMGLARPELEQQLRAKGRWPDEPPSPAAEPR